MMNCYFFNTSWYPIMECGVNKTAQEATSKYVSEFWKVGSHGDAATWHPNMEFKFDVNFGGG